MEVPKPPQMSNAARVFTLVVWLLLVPLGMGFTGWQLYRSTNWSTAAAGDWVTTAILVCAVVAIAYGLTRELLAPWRTQLTAKGITRRDFGGATTLLWRELTRVEARANVLTLRGHDQGRSIRLNLLWFQRPADVISFLAEVAPQAVVRAAA